MELGGVNWEILLYALMPFAAFMYAAVGHGGASSYLMILALLGFAPQEIRPSALILNVFVSLISFLNYRKAAVFPMRLFLTLVIFSVPAAYLGGRILLDATIYKQVLGVLLLFPVLKFAGLFPVSAQPKFTQQPWMEAILGGSIGLLSGMIGIGGGIILSPILLLLGWTGVKETAAVSALFIFVNSIAGFLGASVFQVELSPQLWMLLPLTVAGGALGAYFGAKKWTPKFLTYLLAFVLAFAALKLLIG